MSGKFLHGRLGIGRSIPRLLQAIHPRQSSQDPGVFRSHTGIGGVKTLIKNRLDRGGGHILLRAQAKCLGHLGVGLRDAGLAGHAMGVGSTGLCNTHGQFGQWGDVDRGFPRSGEVADGTQRK